MSGGAAQLGAVSVRLRRAAAGRAVRRLLVLAGLLIGAWLLGCAAQSAHADEMPAPAQVVARTPVLGQAIATVQQRQPVHRVVKAVAGEAQLPRAVEVPKAVSPSRHEPPAAEAMPRVTGSPVRRVHGPGVSRVSKPSPARISEPSRPRAEAGDGGHQAVRHPSLPAPQQQGGDRPSGGCAPSGMTAGFPATAIRAVPAPPRAMPARTPGAVPPAVRTAADEPSFAPD